MQAKDREIALLQQQLGEKVSYQLLINLLCSNYTIVNHIMQMKIIVVGLYVCVCV